MQNNNNRHQWRWSTVTVVTAETHHPSSHCAHSLSLVPINIQKDWWIKWIQFFCSYFSTCKNLHGYSEHSLSIMWLLPLLKHINYSLAEFTYTVWSPIMFSKQGFQTVIFHISYFKELHILAYFRISYLS